jgi:hypothetical protein
MGNFSPKHGIFGQAQVSKIQNHFIRTIIFKHYWPPFPGRINNNKSYNKNKMLIPETGRKTQEKNTSFFYFIWVKFLLVKNANNVEEL